MANPTEHQMEVLSTALTAFQRSQAAVAGGDVSYEAIRAEIGDLNRLYDALIDIEGFDAASALRTHIAMAEHAAALVTRWLVEA